MWRYSPHSWTILEGENPRTLKKIRSPVFSCSRVHDVGRTLVVFPNKSEAFKLTMNAGLRAMYSLSMLEHVCTVNTWALYVLYDLYDCALMISAKCNFGTLSLFLSWNSCTDACGSSTKNSFHGASYGNRWSRLIIHNNDNIQIRGDNLRRPNAIPNGGNGLTNQNPPLALPTPSHIPLTWHSGTEVVTSGSGSSTMFFFCAQKPWSMGHWLCCRQAE
jgi:hypothetical protein